MAIAAPFAATTATAAQGGGSNPGRGGGTVTCEFTPTPENPSARPVRLPSKQAKAGGTVRATIETNYGPMVFDLVRDTAPCAVANLVHLAKADFYDDSQCFRLTDTARLGVLQCGDLIRQEVGGPGYKFPDEVDGTETYPRGTIAMGNQGPGTNGSEWFIVHSFANISPNYTVLGHQVSGFDVLDAIVAAGIADPDGDGPPAQPVVITDVRIDNRNHR
jgi:peptidyl-prolyl cis-trans isomerase B (cyclophilin B)